MKVHILAAAVAAFFTSQANAANIVQNPGFEEGKSHWVGDMGIWEGAPEPRSGLNSAGWVCLATCGRAMQMTQSLKTTVGEKYSLSFWVRNDLTEDPIKSQIQIFFGDIDLGRVEYNEHKTWTKFEFKDLVASDTTTDLHALAWIGAERDGDGGIFFDDFIVERMIANPVPEPAAFSLLGLGVLGAAAARRRRVRKPV